MPEAGKENGARLFSVIPGNRTRGSEHSLKCREFYLNIKTNKKQQAHTFLLLGSLNTDMVA